MKKFVFKKIKLNKVKKREDSEELALIDIELEIDGKVCFVPMDIKNRHYQEFLFQVDKKEISVAGFTLPAEYVSLPDRPEQVV